MFAQASAGRVCAPCMLRIRDIVSTRHSELLKASRVHRSCCCRRAGGDSRSIALPFLVAKHSGGVHECQRAHHCQQLAHQNPSHLPPKLRPAGPHGEHNLPPRLLLHSRLSRSRFSGFAQRIQRGLCHQWRRRARIRLYFAEHVALGFRLCTRRRFVRAARRFVVTRMPQDCGSRRLQRIACRLLLPAKAQEARTQLCIVR